MITQDTGLCPHLELKISIKASGDLALWPNMGFQVPTGRDRRPPARQPHSPMQNTIHWAGPPVCVYFLPNFVQNFSPKGGVSLLLVLVPPKLASTLLFPTVFDPMQCTVLLNCWLFHSMKQNHSQRGISRDSHRFQNIILKNEFQFDFIQAH